MLNKMKFFSFKLFRVKSKKKTERLRSRPKLSPTITLGSSKLLPISQKDFHYTFFRKKSHCVTPSDQSQTPRLLETASLARPKDHSNVFPVGEKNSLGEKKLKKPGSRERLVERIFSRIKRRDDNEPPPPHSFAHRSLLRSV